MAHNSNTINNAERNDVVELVRPPNRMIGDIVGDYDAVEDASITTNHLFHSVLDFFKHVVNRLHFVDAFVVACILILTLIYVGFWFPADVPVTVPAIPSELRDQSDLARTPMKTIDFNVHCTFSFNF
ncbi:hypothetical protein BKA62DRAFT_775127 [Auriculariales sp. MPI-PUGE-AT-0066]|nr:hypothetical protein BKA62DRAFT_775127 [Auriculariales sp. MPI-PUGE-AT-0066]